jgi:hypothetical protein
MRRTTEQALDIDLCVTRRFCDPFMSATGAFVTERPNILMRIQVHFKKSLGQIRYDFLIAAHGFWAMS